MNGSDTKRVEAAGERDNFSRYDISNEFKNSHERTYDLLLFSVMFVVVACLIFECVRCIWFTFFGYFV